jgi:hypothetical protein
MPLNVGIQNTTGLVDYESKMSNRWGFMIERQN